MPDLRDPRDAIVRVTRSAICGTDLHPYRGEIPDFRPGTVLGHEFTGVVEDAGAGVPWRAGQRVLASDLVACGRCWWCRRDLHYQCDDRSLFGYGEVVGSYVPGGQAEWVRVPYADVVLWPIPDEVDDEDVLFVGDILSTGYQGARAGGVGPGDVVAVVGCGPVGLCTVMSARVLGAESVIAVDPLGARRDHAEALGATAADPESAEERIRAATGGRGADVVVEAVGSDAALLSAIELVRPGGAVSVVGAHASDAMPFPSIVAFDKELTLRFVVGDPIAVRGELIGLIVDGRIDPKTIVSHRLPLDEAETGYELFDTGEASKVVLVP